MVVLTMTTRWRTRLAVLVGVLAAGALVPAGGALAGARQPEVVDVTAERFTFTPSEIRVKAGVPLSIRLQSDDTDHGFRIPGTKIDVRIPKRNRGTVSVPFEAAKPGRYEFECSHVCGAGHSFMRGVIVVTE
jgi:cytochrome c oxidase subunit 2